MRDAAVCPITGEARFTRERLQQKPQLHYPFDD